MFKRHRDFSHVEESFFLGKVLPHVKMREEFTASHEIQNEMQTSACGE